MAVILASGVTEAGSTDIVITSGGSATVFLSDASGPALDPSDSAEVQIKATNGEYYPLPGNILNRECTAISIASPGTYRVWRRGAASAFAIEQV